MVDTTVKLSRSQFAVASIALVLVAFGIRLHNLGGDSLWYDELLTLRTSLAGLENMLGVRDHPPLLYVLTSISVHTFSESEFSIRLVSMLGSLVAIPLIISLGRSFGRPLAGLLAALLLAMSPFHLRYAQEARHYALLMSAALAAALMLHMALKRPKLTLWMGYGLATAVSLLTHYSAFILLAAQLVLIAGWLLNSLRRRNFFSRLQYPIAAAVVVIIPHLFRIPQLQNAVGRNVGEETITSFRHSTMSPLPSWLRELYPALGSQNDLLAALLLGLCIMGIVILSWRKEWLNLSFSVTYLILPFILVILFRIDRSASPRYLIYLLPIYLLLAAISLDHVLGLVAWHRGATAGAIGTAVVAAVLLLMSRPLVASEHQHSRQAWREVAQELQESAQDGDVIATMSLVLPNGFNIAYYPMQYHLGQVSKSYHVLNGGGAMQQSDTLDLPNDVANVWGIIMSDKSPEDFSDPQLDVKGFPGNIFLVRNPDDGGSTLDRIGYIYEQALPMALLDNRCMVQQDLATVLLNKGEYVAASQLVFESRQACPEVPNPEMMAERPHLLESLHGLLSESISEAKASGQIREARRFAGAMLLNFPEDPAALSLYIIADFLQLHEAGELEISSTAPEPVDRIVYVVPPDDDARPALFLHAPGLVSYRTRLPDEATIFRSRVSMAPDSWDWGGDGSSFVVLITDEDDTIHEVFRQHVSNEQPDRYWHPVEVSLDSFQGQSVKITLMTEPGPTNSELGDWAIWDSPRISYDLLPSTEQ